MNIVFRIHALRRMAQRHISQSEVRYVVETGAVLEEYPEDRPFPSHLILGWVRDRPLHVVAAKDAVSQETVIVTVYEPDTAKWSGDFRTRRAL